MSIFISIGYSTATNSINIDILHCEVYPRAKVQPRVTKVHSKVCRIYTVISQVLLPGYSWYHCPENNKQNYT